jgi:DNA-binding transcriptional ArsR family regulator
MVIDDVFAVIAEGTRREILGSLRSGDKAVGELVEELAVSQPTVSKHLKVLREAGLVSMRAQGQKRFYSLETAPLDRVADWLSGFSLAPAPAPVPVPAPPAVPAQTPAQARAEAGVPAPAAVHTPAPAAAAAYTTAEPAPVPPPSLAPAVTAPATAAGAVEVPADERVQQQIGRTVGRAAGRAADLIAHLPKLRRRREP